MKGRLCGMNEADFDTDDDAVSWAAANMFVTTEHFNLQTARAATIAEANGRASVFLGAVSAGLVAFAFAGQSSRTGLYVFGLVLFPILFVLGVTTFSRVLEASIADTLYALRINRLRRFYLIAPRNWRGTCCLPRRPMISPSCCATRAIGRAVGERCSAHPVPSVSSTALYSVRQEASRRPR